MKKLFILLSAIMILQSCKKEEPKYIYHHNYRTDCMIKNNYASSTIIRDHKLSESEIETLLIESNKRIKMNCPVTESYIKFIEISTEY